MRQPQSELRSIFLNDDLPGREGRRIGGRQSRPVELDQLPIEQAGSAAGLFNVSAVGHDDRPIRQLGFAFQDGSDALFDKRHLAVFLGDVIHHRNQRAIGALEHAVFVQNLAFHQLALPPGVHRESQISHDLDAVRQRDAVGRREALAFGERDHLAVQHPHLINFLERSRRLAQHAFLRPLGAKGGHAGNQKRGG